MKKSRKRAGVIAFILAVGLFLQVPVVETVYADAVPVVTLGADLSEEQKSMILQFFGTNVPSVDVLTVTNQDERQYLEGLVADDIIGTRTLSCSYICPMNSGGIIVKTANLNWVSDGMLANALLTCGVENCQVIATAPFEVSGTGALTGVMKAYEKSSGEVLDESKKELATEELVLTGELIDAVTDSGLAEEKADVAESVELNKYIVEMLNDMKIEALNGNLTKEKAQEIVEARLKEYGVDLSDELLNKLVDYIMSFSSESYSKDFTKAINSLTERISKGFDINFNLNLTTKIEADETISGFMQLWENFLAWLQYIFSPSEVKESLKSAKDSVTNIFNHVNTNIIKYDEQLPDIVPEALGDTDSSTPDVTDVDADVEADVGAESKLASNPTDEPAIESDGVAKIEAFDTVDLGEIEPNTEESISTGEDLGVVRNTEELK